MGRKATRDVPQSDTLTAGELRLLQTLHEGLPRAFGTSLSTVLRNPVEVSLAGVDQLAYGKFVHGLEDPSYFNVLKAEPLGDRLMLDVELAILYPMLDRLLGGHGDDPPPRRPPTDIELPLAGRIVRLFLKDLHEAWQGVLPLRFEVLQVGSHPRLLRVLPSDETVVLVSFALTIGNRQGMMRLCLPCRAIRQIADKLTARGRMEPSAAARQERARPTMPTIAARAPRWPSRWQPRRLPQANSPASASATSSSRRPLPTVRRSCRSTANPDFAASPGRLKAAKQSCFRRPIPMRASRDYSWPEKNSTHSVRYQPERKRG